jgi:peptide chain release factor 1
LNVAPSFSLPAVLLHRAQKLSAEYGQLQNSLEASFDTKAAKRAGEIAGVADALKAWNKGQSSLAELTAMLNSKDEEMRELARDEIEPTNAQLQKLAQDLSAALVPKDPYADLPCLIEIRPGPGGLEGRFFADSIFKMYQAYCIRKGFRAKVAKYEIADGAGDSTGTDGERGLQEAVLEIQTEGSYDTFRGESGMHRVQRIPTTEKSGRVHTSAVAVWVLPAFPQSGTKDNDFNDPESDFYIDPTEVRSEKMRASGAGGQHVNKTESAIRLTHVPTGTVVSMQESRSQVENRENAWKLLRSRVAAQRREQREEKAYQLRRNVLSAAQITRGDKIRTYNYNQDRCTDHRCGLDVHNLPNVLEGGEVLDKVFDAVKAWQKERDVQNLLAEEEAAAPGSSTT